MEQEEANDAWYSELLPTPMDTLVKSEDDATVTGTGASPNGEGLSTTATSTGLHWRDAYCLLVRIVHNVDCMSVLDTKVPDYVW